MAHQITTVDVPLRERAYGIEIGSGCLDQVAEYIRRLTKLTHAVVISDSNVSDLYATKVVEQLQAVGARVDLAVVAAGEPSKSIEQAHALWQQMLDFRADRKSVVVPVGGGVIGDLGGFIAATFARGLSMIQIPTTLLAQVDSSVGGKVGVNLPAAKNMVGAFWQPRGVLIDIDVLQSLPEREYRAGLAEVVKYGVILDADFFAFLEANLAGLNGRDGQVLTEVVATCCRLKAVVVANDEREETGLRAVLNYGHTFCHAIESLSGYGEFLHGEAVAIGMLCASRLAAKMGRIDPALTRRQHDLLTALALPVAVPDLNHDELISCMRRDKKVEHGELRFVLPSRLGHVELVGQVDEADVRWALADQA